MAKLLEIYTTKDPKQMKVLRKISEAVSKEEISSTEFQSFLNDLIYTAQRVKTEEGYSAAGVAAIQVGVEKEVFCILREDSGEFEIMINPEIKILKKDLVTEVEACLSVPKKEGKVARYKKIKVKYLDRNGKVKKGTFSNMEAREIQHEFDHTQGILFTDKIVD